MLQLHKRSRDVRHRVADLTSRSRFYFLSSELYKFLMFADSFLVDDISRLYYLSMNLSRLGIIITFYIYYMAFQLTLKIFVYSYINEAECRDDLISATIHPLLPALLHPFQTTNVA